MANTQHQDHASDLDQLRAAITELFGHVQDWMQRADDKKKAAEGLMELRDKTHKLLILIEKADKGLSAISEASDKIESANKETGRRLDAMDAATRGIGTSLAAVESATKDTGTRFNTVDTKTNDILTKLGSVVTRAQAMIIIGLLVANLALSVWRLLK